MVVETVTVEMNSLPPQWVDHYDSCIFKLKQLDAVLDTISNKGRERIKKGFGDNTALDSQIYSLTKDSNLLIRECEQALKDIDNHSLEYSESQSDYQIRKNMKASLAQQISESTIRLRKQQKTIYDALKRFGNSTDTSSQSTQDSESQSQSQLQNEDIYSDLVRGRETQINTLVDQINELSDIYKTLGLLVIDSGTLLDRIDVNIQTTKDNIQKSNKHLTSAVKHQESPFSSRIIQILIGMIIFFTFILVSRYSS